MKWSLNDLAAVVKDIRENKLSVRAAAAAHGIPEKFTVRLCVWQGGNRQQAVVLILSLQ